MHRSFLWLLLFLPWASCRAPQSNVERWRAEVQAMDEAAKERLANANDAELWEMARERMQREYQLRRSRVRRSVGPVGGGSGVQGLYIFDVSDLVHGVSDFAAPRLGDLRRPEDRGERQEGYLRPSQGAFSEDALLEMITGAVLPKDFEERGGSVSLVGGRLIIREPQGAAK